MLSADRNVICTKICDRHKEIIVNMSKECNLRRMWCVDLAGATKFIAFAGMVASSIIGICLLKDRYARNHAYLDKISHFLGYDLEVMAYSVQLKMEAEYIKWILIMLHTILHLLSSFILLLGSYASSTWCAVPWLLCKIIGIIVKVVALGHDLAYSVRNTRSFYLFSFIYIVLVIWFWTVVLIAQILPYRTLHLSSSVKGRNNIAEDQDVEKFGLFQSESRKSVFDSPSAYTPNVHYTQI